MLVIIAGSAAGWTLLPIRTEVQSASINSIARFIGCYLFAATPAYLVMIDGRLPAERTNCAGNRLFVHYLSSEVFASGYRYNY